MITYIAKKLFDQDGNVTGYSRPRAVRGRVALPSNDYVVIRHQPDDLNHPLVEEYVDADGRDALRVIEDDAEVTRLDQIKANYEAALQGMRDNPIASITTVANVRQELRRVRQILRYLNLDTGE